MDIVLCLFENQLLDAKMGQPGSSPGSSRSRSTSAGSSPARSSIEHSTPKLEAAKAQTLELPVMNYPSPLMVRNTFFDYAERSPKSFADFLQERQVQSCPGSKLGAPPGLEHFGSQISESDEDADFVPMRSDTFVAMPVKGTELPDFEYPSPFVVRNTFLDTKESRHLGSLADFIVERQARSLPASGIGLPPGLSGMCSSSSITVEPAPAEPQGFCFSQPPAYAPVLPNLQPTTLPPPPPMAPPALPPAAQISGLTSFVVPPPPAQAPQLRIAESLPETRLGTPEMPTVGSSGHYLGTCKPCAFLFSKGCSSGVGCTFCHLCPPGEKKRRQKFKHAAAKMTASLAASGLDAPLAAATAANWAVAQAAAKTLPAYSQVPQLQKHGQ
eukprot:TRINITY_DN2562_c0_g1_i4.p1 TRINITY_DN2562_c0_g1~~TRINITY_DN2562_c0_g1_i4.p1  ORF type:complete len:385 (+),score=83.15 TRINITY_DN2562_c0_g1_i4:134-1288(+)